MPLLGLCRVQGWPEHLREVRLEVDGELIARGSQHNLDMAVVTGFAFAGRECHSRVSAWKRCGAGLASCHLVGDMVIREWPGGPKSDLVLEKDRGMRECRLV